MRADAVHGHHRPVLDWLGLAVVVVVAWYVLSWILVTWLSAALGG